MLKTLTVLFLILALAFAQESESSESSSESSSETSVTTSSPSGTSSESSSESDSGESDSGESSSDESGSGSESSGGETSNVVSSNYFRYAFGNLYIAYAIDKCSATDLFGASFIMPSCIDDSTIAVTMHTNDNCTAPSGSTEIYNLTSSEVFMCSGQNTYAAVSLGAGSCDVMIYAGIDACVQYSTLSTTSYSSFTCESMDETNLNVYTSSQCDGTPIVQYDFLPSCNYTFTYIVDVYGAAVDCSAAMIQTTQSGSGESSGESDDESSDESDDESSSGGGGSMTTTSSGGGGGSSDTTTTSSTNPTSSETNSGNMIPLQNIFGIFIMIACLLVAKL